MKIIKIFMCNLKFYGFIFMEFQIINGFLK